MVQGTDATGELLKAASDEDEAVRWFAIEAIRTSVDDRYVNGKHVVSTAEELITDEDEYVRQAALDLISESGRQGIARLLQLVPRDDETGLGEEALWTLRHWVDAHGEPGVGILVQFVQSNTAGLRDAALLVMGKVARLAALKLIELMSDPDEDIRINALSALLEIGEGAIPFLRTAVESRREPACTFAQRALDGFRRLRANEHLRTVVPLSKLARLMTIDESSALPMLNKQLRSADKKARFIASKALVYIGQASVPILTDSLGSSDTNLRRRACEALRDIASPEARDALREALTDTDVKVRQNAVRGLARIGNPDDVSALRSLPSDQSKAVRRTVKEVLAMIS
jgi:HEAT repeat protein